MRSGLERFRQVRERPGPPRGDHGDSHACRRGLEQIKIVPLLRPVTVHRGQQNLTRAKGLHLFHPGEAVERRRLAATGNEDLPLFLWPRLTTHIHRHDHALAAERIRQPTNQIGIANGARHVRGARQATRGR